MEIVKEGEEEGGKGEGGKEEGKGRGKEEKVSCIATLVCKLTLWVTCVE